MIGAILGWFTSGTVGKITERLADAYEMKLRAETDEKKLEVEEAIARLEAQQNILLAEQGRWLTAWIRPVMAAPIAIYIWKLFVYDATLGLGTTPSPGEIMTWILTAIVGAYFVTRPLEKVFKRK
jgi:hypothetical protein